VVVQGGSLLACESAGLADRQIAVPWGASTPSQIASISKQFVAVVALLLADRGLVRVDDSVATFLPEAPKQWKAVRLRHLMTHTSGLPHWCELPGFNPAVPDSPQRRLQQFLNSPLDNVPGEVWRYSSPGYVVLSAVLERAAQRRYADLATELIIKRLALANTTIASMPDRLVARGYRAGLPVPPWDLHSMPGTGDVWSSAVDVARFITALHEGGLLPPRLQVMLRDTTVPLGRGQDASAQVTTKR